MTGPDALSFDPFAGFEPSPSANPANPAKAQSLSASSRLAANANPANPDGTGDKNEGGLARPANRKDPDNDLGLAGLAGLAGGQPLGRDSLLPEAEGDPPPWWCQTLVPPPGAACSCCQGRRWWNEREGGLAGVAALATRPVTCQRGPRNGDDPGRDPSPDQTGAVGT